jgi:hypothetical protein
MHSSDRTFLRIISWKRLSGRTKTSFWQFGGGKFLAGRSRPAGPYRKEQKSARSPGRYSNGPGASSGNRSVPDPWRLGQPRQSPTQATTEPRGHSSVPKGSRKRSSSTQAGIGRKITFLLNGETHGFLLKLDGKKAENKDCGECKHVQ